MNYSTLKKTVVLSLVSLMAIGVASAQTDSTKKKMMMSDTSSTAKVFGGTSQYNTWSIGINAGVTSGLIPFWNNSTSHFEANLGFGASLKDQISHSLAIQLEYYGGRIFGNDNGGTKGNGIYTYAGNQYKTDFSSISLGGVVDIGNISFLHRQSGIILFVSGGVGLDIYKPKYIANGTTGYISYSNTVKELAAPVGSGIKFKLSDKLDLKLGYTMTFVDGYNFTGFHTYPDFSHYSYTYAGLDYTLGPKNKPSLEWVNPVAMMYDELYDAALRAEVEALKGRVTNVETAVSDLKKDSDGDGVADQFDKCPNTPANTVVDGSGCPIVFPKVDTAKAAPVVVNPYSNIQFEFDSSVLKTSSYPALDATSAALKADGSVVTVAGYASSEGTAAHNMHLSKDRANSVKTYLVNSGVDAKRIKVKAFGETHPIADNSTEEGRITNRRVEFHK